MHTMKRLAITAVVMLSAACLATPALDRLWSTRVKCEIQTADGDSLQDLVWQQGTTPRLSLDQFRSGKAVDADTNVTAIVIFGPSATNNYYVASTNYATSGNGYLVNIPTVGTNTAGVAAGWWYTVYFEASGKRYWTGNGRLDIEATTSTADGLHWQAVTCGAETDPVALPLVNAVSNRVDGIATNYLRVVDIGGGVYQMYKVAE